MYQAGETIPALVFDMGSYYENHFIRPKFSPLPPLNGEPLAGNSIKSLPELIRYNAIHNGDRTFCMQGHEGLEHARRITFKQLDDAISACSIWVEKQLVPSNEGPKSRPKRPVALYLESDVGLFIYIATMLASNIPVSIILNT
jgi:acyl-CoA synthetase (AMP-forming)/AMP-acid ligase II